MYTIYFWWPEVYFGERKYPWQWTVYLDNVELTLTTEFFSMNEIAYPNDLEYTLTTESLS